MGVVDSFSSFASFAFASTWVAHPKQCHLNLSVGSAHCGGEGSTESTVLSWHQQKTVESLSKVSGKCGKCGYMMSSWKTPRWNWWTCFKDHCSPFSPHLLAGVSFCSFKRLRYYFVRNSIVTLANRHRVVCPKRLQQACPTQTCRDFIRFRCAIGTSAKWMNTNKNRIKRSKYRK